MFDGFAPLSVETQGLTLRGVRGGEGPPLLLLHGYPQTHVMWHGAAPALTKRFDVIVLDLPGYGASDAPPLSETHEAYSKRAMAKAMVGAMAALGHERFLLAGHDRGARVSYRLALDHPEHVERLALLDIIPTISMWELANAQFAVGTFHWGFLAQPAPFPETMIAGNPDAFLDYCMTLWAADGFRFDEKAMDAYRAAFRNPSVIAGTCECYRAGATVDVEIDRATRDAGQKIACPSLLIWGSHNFGKETDPILGLWRTFIEDPKALALDCGHFVAEEKPDETARALLDFFATET